MDILEKFTERANYFSEPARLVFEWNLWFKKSQKLPDSIKTVATIKE